MAFDGAGVFQRLYNWVADRDAAIKILAQKHDDEDDGFAAAINSIVGQTVNFLAPVRGTNGTPASPAFTFKEDLTKGIEGGTTDELGISIAGNNILKITANGIDIIGAVSASTQADFAARFLGTSPIGPFVKDDWRAMVFDDERFDKGSDYNAGTGVFTAPRDGRYWFELHATYLLDTLLPTSMLVGLGVNGGDPVKDTTRPAEGAPLVSTRSGAQIGANIQLTQGDTVTPYVQFQGEDASVYHTYGAFSGFEKI